METENFNINIKEWDIQEDFWRVENCCKVCARCTEIKTEYNNEKIFKEK